MIVDQTYNRFRAAYLAFCNPYRGAQSTLLLLEDIQLLNEEVAELEGDVNDLETYNNILNKEIIQQQARIEELLDQCGQYSRELITLDNGLREWHLRGQQDQQTILALEARLEQYALARPTHTPTNQDL